MKVVFTKTLKLCCRFLENKKLFIDLLQGGPQWPINCYYNKFKTHNIKRCKTKRVLRLKNISTNYGQLSKLYFVLK